MDPELKIIGVYSSDMNWGFDILLEESSAHVCW